MKTYKVDLDYESYLFDPNYTEDSKQNQKIIREFEYVFFLINRETCKLKNYKGYEKAYLEHLRRLGFVIPSLDPQANIFNYWWGHRHDKKTEQVLNSKITSAELAQKFNWGFFDGAIVSSADEIINHVKKHSYSKWILKKPDSFSGIGHVFLDKENLDKDRIQKIVKGPILLEPLHERVFDIGTTFVVNHGIIERQFMIENLNSMNGAFKGGVGSINVDKFKKYIHSKYSYDLSELEVIAKSIAEEYFKLGARSNIQIDSFVYRTENGLKLYPLVEVNYRKTMGLVIQSLADKFQGTVEWRVQKEVMQDDSWIQLSPQDNQFQSCFKVI